MSIHHVTPKQCSHLDTAKPALQYTTECDGWWQLVTGWGEWGGRGGGGMYCRSSHRTSRNKKPPVGNPSHTRKTRPPHLFFIFFFLPKSVSRRDRDADEDKLVSCLMTAGDTGLRRKQLASRLKGGTTHGCEAAASGTLIGAKSCNKHTINSTGSTSLTPLLLYHHYYYYWHHYYYYYYCCSFFVIVYLRYTSPAPGGLFLQADVSLKRYCP